MPGMQMETEGEIMKKYMYFAGAVICILFLYFLGVMSHPSEINISDAEKHEGEKVVVKGTVIKKECNEKFEVVTIKDGNCSIKIFVYGSTDTGYGDKVKVSGKVERYDGEIEIFADHIKICERWDRRNIPLWELSENFMEYIGTNVNVTGYVYGIYADYFYLTDFEREYKIKVFYPKNFSLGVENHEHVHVKALFEYNPKKLCMYMEINGNEHGVAKMG
ncbi:MAG: hypothetical protein U9O96_04765 [Candidatus Thermoplasmatota archaeon]|nr:hypothetical protein [Candidatus Thermoplasmatota archaeon]